MRYNWLILLWINISQRVEDTTAPLLVCDAETIASVCRIKSKHNLYKKEIFSTLNAFRDPSSIILWWWMIARLKTITTTRQVYPLWHWQKPSSGIRTGCWNTYPFFGLGWSASLCTAYPLATSFELDSLRFFFGLLSGVSFDTVLYTLQSFSEQTLDAIWQEACWEYVMQRSRVAPLPQNEQHIKLFGVDCAISEFFSLKCWWLIAIRSLRPSWSNVVACLYKPRSRHMAALLFNSCAHIRWSVRLSISNDHIVFAELIVASVVPSMVKAGAANVIYVCETKIPYYWQLPCSKSLFYNYWCDGMMSVHTIPIAGYHKYKREISVNCWSKIRFTDRENGNSHEL